MMTLTTTGAREWIRARRRHKLDRERRLRALKLGGRVDSSGLVLVNGKPVPPARAKRWSTR
jgi:hypothetical protein